MSDIQQQPSPKDETIRRAVLIGRNIVVNSILFLALSIFLTIQTGGAWQVYVMMVLTFLMFIGGLIGINLLRRERLTLGGWLLFSWSWITPLFAVIVLTNLGYVAIVYIALSSYFVISWVLPKRSRGSAIAIALIAILASGVFEYLNPAWRLESKLANTLSPIIAAILGLLFLGILLRRSLTGNIRTKLTVGFLFVSVLSVAIVAVVITYMAQATLQNQIGQQLHSVAVGRGLIIGDYINGQVNALQTFSLDETIRQSVRAANALKPDLSSITKLDDQWRQGVDSGTNNSLINSRLSNSLSNDLRAFQSLAPENIEVFITDRAGALVSATNVTSDYYQADEDWWISTYQDGVGAVYINQPEIAESADVLSIFIAVPIYDTRQGDLIGVMHTTISLESLLSVVSEPIGETGEVDILFPDETMLDTREGEYEEIAADSMVALQDSTNQIYIRALFEENDRILSQSPVQSQSSIAEVNELGWNIVASQDANEALAPVREQVRLTSFFATIMAGVAALVSLVVSQRLARPIVNLTETANNVAEGNMDARALVESQDEIGQLAKTFNAMTTQLQETLVGLEERVTERTAELEVASQQVERRAEQFEAIAQVSHIISSIQDQEELLPRITRMISQHFAFYHVGIFLLDENNQYAVLRAANSEGGQRMLARKHQLEVGQTGIVGYVTSTGSPRIALDTGTDAVYFDNPDLPDTRSEMALPLTIGGNIIGALDVQSTEPNAFTQEDIDILSALADQVSTAIQNARLYEESREALAQAEAVSRQLTGEAWSNVRRFAPIVGYRFDGTKPEPLTQPINGKQTKKQKDALSVPVQLRGETIGRLRIKPAADGHEWTEDEIAIIRATAERVALAAENARLILESQKNAAKEQVIGEISSKIGASINLDNILQTTLREMGRILPGAEISIQVENEEAAENV